MFCDAKRCLLHVHVWAVVVLCSLLCSSLVRADSRVLLVQGKGVSADAQRAVGAAVADVAELLDAREYLSLTRAKRLQPASDAALRELAPRLRASLIVVTRRERGKLVIDYRDGRSGAPVGQDRFGLPRRGKKDPRLHQQVAAAVQNALSGSAPSRAAQPPSAVEPEPEDRGFDSEADSEQEEVAPVAQPQAAVPSRSELAGPAAGGSEPELEPESEAEPTNSAGPEERLGVALSVGVGAGTRATELPTREGLRSLTPSPYPGLALSFALQGMLGSHFRLAAAADYRTSLGVSSAETAPLGSERKSSLRSHSLSFGVAPGYRFGAADGVVLQLFVGWLFQGLRSVVDEAFPTISWHGAVLRPELILPFGAGRVSLRLAPELVAVAGIYTTLTGRTGLAGSGLGFGGELALQVRLAAWLSLGFEYRETHMALGTSWGADLTDVVRFGSARLILQY